MGRSSPRSLHLRSGTQFAVAQQLYLFSGVTLSPRRASRQRDPACWLMASFCQVMAVAGSWMVSSWSNQTMRRTAWRRPLRPASAGRCTARALDHQLKDRRWQPPSALPGVALLSGSSCSLARPDGKAMVWISAARLTPAAARDYLYGAPASATKAKAEVKISRATMPFNSGRSSPGDVLLAEQAKDLEPLISPQMRRAGGFSLMVRRVRALAADAAYRVTSPVAAPSIAAALSMAIRGQPVAGAWADFRTDLDLIDSIDPIWNQQLKPYLEWSDLSWDSG